MSTAAPFIDAHSPGWGTGPVMAVATDGCFVLSLQSDSTLSRYGVAGGAWPRVFRWVTGLATVWLNIGAAALTKDVVGVVVHLIPPLLLLLVAEAGPAYRRSLAHLARRAAEEATPPPFDDGFGPLYTVPEPVLTPVPTPAPTMPAVAPVTPGSAAPAIVPAVSGGTVNSATVHPVLTPATSLHTPAPAAPAEPAPEAPAEPVGTAPTDSVNTDADAVNTPLLTEGDTEQAAGADDSEDDEPDAGAVRLSEADAAAVIEKCWRHQVGQREAARRATRSPSFVAKVYKRLDSQHDQPVPAAA
ncbi:hypothetical protein [Streptomyces sp. NRRL B-24484]|uniref:hypothetical protein n=1 Tax=Streptomyces sp. NRRL B-24484 TaxID=1463833 RepID=UPI000B11EB24|nr:hypothetical protein [Streptomyces sp. NRRL B-24484]